MSGSIVFAGIAPHPPLLVPEIGGQRIERVADSERALREFSRRLLATRPETIVVISPHSPLNPHAFTARSSAELRGDFRDFYAPDVSLTFANDLELLDAIASTASDEDVAFNRIARDVALDHGALVPLYYLREAGWRGPVVVIGFTQQSTDAHLAFGQVIARAAQSLNRRIAVVASGDLSHRLIVGGPYEFEPTAHLFDEQIVEAIASGDANKAINIDRDLRERAGECGYRSILVALGSVERNLRDSQVLSYEGPFGVGYMVAVLVE
jgi:aromatic ring-opening dioxygenase LigB subunit